MVYRVYVEKKPGLDHEAQALKGDLQSLLGIRGLANVYEALGIGATGGGGGDHRLARGNGIHHAIR